MAKDRQTIWQKSLFHTEQQSCSIAEWVGSGQELLALSKPAVFILGGILLQFWMVLSVLILFYQTFWIMFYATEHACGRLGTLVTGHESFPSWSRSLPFGRAQWFREVGGAGRTDSCSAASSECREGQESPSWDMSSPVWPWKGNKVDENIHVSIKGQPALFQYKYLLLSSSAAFRESISMHAFVFIETLVNE